jgi:hypothetical protein
VIVIPSQEELQNEIAGISDSDPRRIAAAADFLDVIKKFDLKAGPMEIKYPYKNFSIQAAAFRLGIPFTGHPMFGHDIIYNHPMNLGSAVGRCAERDFLAFAHNVSRLDGGVYLSVGSAVMSPMIFEKSMSMAQNTARQKGAVLKDHYILVADLQKSSWDWSKGEPPEDNPDYYLRFNKSFSRMGGTMRYICCDNRDLLLNLYNALDSK